MTGVFQGFLRGSGVQGFLAKSSEGVIANLLVDRRVPRGNQSQVVIRIVTGDLQQQLPHLSPESTLGDAAAAAAAGGDVGHWSRG